MLLRNRARSLVSQQTFLLFNVIFFNAILLLLFLISDEASKVVLTSLLGNIALKLTNQYYSFIPVILKDWTKKKKKVAVNHCDIHIYIFFLLVAADVQVKLQLFIYTHSFRHK